MLKKIFLVWKKRNTNLRLSIRDITLIGMMVAVIETSKMIFAFLPNVELTTFWIIMFSHLFGWKILFTIWVFILIEVVIYPFGLWIVMYLYLWPLIALIARAFHKVDSILFWSILSGFFGLTFGFWCSIPYIFVNIIGTDLSSGIIATTAWWIAGIPWDIVHGIANFILMLVLYTPVRYLVRRLSKEYSLRTTGKCENKK